MAKIEQLLFLQKGLCFYCKKPLPREKASIDHLVPVSHGGSNDKDNCVACCQTINMYFGNMGIKEKVRFLIDCERIKCPEEFVNNKQNKS